MSNPTTPFGWQMPTATDLVTDLPADFEVFGQAVATSMADLLGGTSILFGSQQMMPTRSKTQLLMQKAILLAQPQLIHQHALQLAQMVRCLRLTQHNPQV
jgi:hypothetical protein